MLSVIYSLEFFMAHLVQSEIPPEKSWKAFCYLIKIYIVHQKEEKQVWTTHNLASCSYRIRPSNTHVCPYERAGKVAMLAPDQGGPLAQVDPCWHPPSILFSTPPPPQVCCLLCARTEYLVWRQSIALWYREKPQRKRKYHPLTVF